MESRNPPSNTVRPLLRLWRLPFRYAVWLALPIQIVVLWIAIRGYESYEHYLSFKRSFFAASRRSLSSVGR